MSDLRQRIAQIARTWVKTPFYPHIARKGIGADCVNLGLAIFKEAGHIPAHVELPPYRLDAGDHLQSSLVLEWLARSPYFEPEEGMPQPGSVITLKIGKVDHHIGVVVDGNSFVHAIRDYGVVLGDLRDSTWMKRLRTCWRPKV